MERLQDNYFALIIIPLGLLIISALITYKLGLRIFPSIGIGLILSLISIVVLHKFHFDDNNKLINEIGNVYVSIYIITDLLLLLIIFCYLILKNANNKCCLCCLKCCPNYCTEKGPEYLYEGNVEQDSVDVRGYTSATIEHYKDDILGYTTDEANSFIRYSPSGFAPGFKIKTRLPEPTENDEEWIDGGNIGISEYQPDDAYIPNDLIKANDDDGLLYEAKPKKIFTNSGSDWD